MPNKKLVNLAIKLKQGEITPDEVPANVRTRVVRAAETHTIEHLKGTPRTNALAGTTRSLNRIANVITN